MLHVINKENQQEYLVELASMHCLRKRIVIDQKGWQHANIRVVFGMEFDQFDTDKAHYLVHQNDAGVVDACVRLISIQNPTLLFEVFSDLVTDDSLLKDGNIWEASRFFVDQECEHQSMAAILAAGMLEFALVKGISKYVSVSHIAIERIMARIDWKPKRLGPIIDTGNEKIAGETFEVSQATYDQVRDAAGLYPQDAIINLEDILSAPR